MSVSTYDRMRKDRITIFKNNDIKISQKIYPKYFTNELSIIRLKTERNLYQELLKQDLIVESKILFINEFVEGLTNRIDELIEKNKIHTGFYKNLTQK